MSDPDRRLARKAARGDREALIRLYERHRRGLFGYLARMLPDRGIAEEAFQEAWIKVLQHIETYRPDPGPFKAWLFRIASNTAIDRLRREGKHQAASLDAPIHEESGPREIDRLPSSLPGPDRLQEVRMLGTELAGALGTLPERQRSAVLLKHQQGLSYVEIARTLEVPEGTAKILVHRGVLALRRRLREGSDVRA